MEPEDVKRAQAELYEAGEYWALSATLEAAAVELVAAAAIAPGARVLDVGAGDGNVAVAAARAGADVVAVDLSEAQVRRGRSRSAREGVAVEWVVGDAESLPFADASFDAVVSAFGVVFAPNPAAAAAELARVCRRSGVVAVTAWARDGYMPALTRALAAAAPSAIVPDVDLGWGDADIARTRLERHCDVVGVDRRTLWIDPDVRGAAGPDDCAASYLRRQLDSDELHAAAAARDEVTALFTRGGCVAADYLVVVGRRS